MSAEDLPLIKWRVHFRSSPEAVWEAWTTDAGRERFWAEKSESVDGGFNLRFVNGQTLFVRVTESSKPARFVFGYFGGSRVTVQLNADGRCGCDLQLTEEGVSSEEHLANYAGWISVLLACKAAVDFQVDLRSHDIARTWDAGYIDV